MKNGVTFDLKHTIDDWGLLMISKDIGEAEPRINYIEIEGRDGSIDLTEALGEVKYNNRILSFNFDLFNPVSFWESKQTISNYLNGKKRKIILDQDPNYYYYGRCSVKNVTREKNLAKFQIECNCDPYKMMINETIIKKEVKPTDKIILNNQRKHVMPKIESTGDIVFKFEDKQFNISSSTTFQSPDFILKYGENEVEIISGTGSLTFTYREGSL